MNTLAKTLLLILSVSFTAFGLPGKQASKKGHPTKLAHYQISTYMAVGEKLRVNVDKELGGKVYIKLTDAKGTLYFDQTLNPEEAVARLSLDLTDLTDGNYTLKVSNGLEMEIREIKVTTQEPTSPARKLTVL